MSIEKLRKVYLFRMTHIENISHILKCGITHQTSENNNPDYIPIGDGGLIATGLTICCQMGSDLEFIYLSILGRECLCYL
jgi:hypothetical protein